MSENRTTPMPEPATPELRTVPMPAPVEDPNEVLFEEDYGLQKLLGLTPVSFHMAHEDHPQPRGCPWWCRARSDGDGHAINPDTPFKARHDFAPTGHVALGLYFGEEDFDLNVVRTAVLEVKMTKLGTAGPVLKFSRSSGIKQDGKRSWMSHPEILRVSLPEAREIAAVLNYLVDVAEADGPES